VPSRKIGEKRILSITQDKKGKHHVTLDGGKLILSDDAFTEQPLYVGKTLTSLEYRELLSFLSIEKLMDYGLSLSAKGCYSTHQVKEKLRTKCDEEDSVRQVIFKLKKEGFLDDVAFAKQYQEEKENQLYGKDRILRSLRYEKGVSDEFLASLRFLRERVNAERALQLLKKKWPRLPLRAKRIKAVAALTRRGFDASLSEAVVSSITETPALVKKDLRILSEKTIKKYERKYNDYDLRAKCFAFLLSKGYRSEDIASVLEDLL
jgi:SOS response regulatory protein OraA/RecX